MTASETASNAISWNDIIYDVDLDEIKNYLFSNVPQLSYHDVELIESRPTKADKMMKLIQTLDDRNVDVIRHLIDALAASEVKAYQMLAKDLKAIDLSRLKSRQAMKQLYETCSRPLRLRIQEEERIPFIVRKIARQLGEDALTKYSDPVSDKHILAMRNLVRDIHPNRKDSISHLAKSASSLKKIEEYVIELLAEATFGECNWGRIVTWFAFWGEVADYLEGDLEESEEQEMRRCGQLAGLLMISRCGKWIQENGGWDNLFDMCDQNKSIA